MQECNRSGGWKQLQSLRILYQERKRQSFAFIPYNFIPEARNGTLTDTGVLPCASELGYDQRLDYKDVN